MSKRTLICSVNVLVTCDIDIADGEAHLTMRDARMSMTGYVPPTPDGVTLGDKLKDRASTAAIRLGFQAILDKMNEVVEKDDSSNLAPTQGPGASA